MPNYITAQDWYREPERLPLLDVRSPGEYRAGHLIGALSLPLFSNEERAEVGTLYKQSSPDVAFLRGLEIAGAKMRFFVEEARSLVSKPALAIHCWRGGQRSASMAWLLEKAGFEVQVIEGGYKAARKWGRTLMEQMASRFVVLGGPTGSGKTKVLNILASSGQHVIDLEQLANHKGSAFGGLGEEPQPTSEQFENALVNELHQIPDDSKPIWLENESKGIGKVFLPALFYKVLQQAPLWQLDIPIEHRTTQLVADYGCFSSAELRSAFDNIRKRLGGQHYLAAITALENANFAKAARIALVYYDKSYAYGLNQRTGPMAGTIAAQSTDAEVIAQQILHAVFGS